MSTDSAAAVESHGVSLPRDTFTEDGAQIKFRELFDLIWSGRWLVAAIMFSVMGLSAAYLIFAAPVYQANGLLQVEEDKSAIAASVDELSQLIGAKPGDAPAEIAIVKSRMVLSTVVETMRLNIAISGHYMPFFGRRIAKLHSDAKEPVNAFLGLRQFVWGGEKILIPTFEVPESQQDKEFLLRKTDAGYDLYDRDKNRVLQGTVGTVANSGTGISILVAELRAQTGTEFFVVKRSPSTVFAELSDAITVAEQPKESGILSILVEGPSPEYAARLLNEIEKSYLAQNVERRSGTADRSIQFLNKQLPEIRVKVEQAQSNLNAYQSKVGSVDVTQETQGALQKVVDIETQRLGIVEQRAIALQSFTSQHPTVVALDQQIALLDAKEKEAKKFIELLPQRQQEYISLQRDVDVNTGLLTSLLNSAQQLQITKAGTTGNVRVIDTALSLPDPIKPKKVLIALVGLFLGVFSGVSAVFVARTLLGGVDRPEEVERALGLPTYASIPYSQAQAQLSKKLGTRALEGVGLLASLSNSDPAMEALRSLRTTLHFAMLESTNNVVMFTGPLPGLGKSFVTINLAAVLAMSGKKVVVVDADLRRGILYKYVGVPKKPGLSDYISGDCEMSDALKETSIKGLGFMAGGTRPPNPSEILMSDRFSILIKELSATHDYVLLDTPPVLPVSDASVVGRIAGTTLLVLKAAEHPMRSIEETVKRLRHAGVHVKGTVFNQVGAHIGSYGYGSYGYQYGYSADRYGPRPD